MKGRGDITPAARGTLAWKRQKPRQIPKDPQDDPAAGREFLAAYDAAITASSEGE